MTNNSQEHQDKVSPFKKLERKAIEENLVKIMVSKAEPIIMQQFYAQEFYSYQL